MTEATGSDADAPAPSDPDAIRADIEKTRAELADTVDALSSKLDVKGRAGDKVSEVKGKVADTASSVKHAAPEPVQRALDEKVVPVAHKAAQQASPYRKQIALGALAGFVVLLVVRKRRADTPSQKAARLAKRRAR